MESMVVPVDVIALCRAGGEITPLRIRGQLREQPFRGEVLEVVRTRRMGHLGAETMLYECWVNTAGRKELMELKYHFASGVWKLICLLC